METIDNLINAVPDKSNHLFIAKMKSSSYYTDFLHTADLLKKVMNPQMFKDWLCNKMLLKQSSFDEKAFIQYAIEASTMRYFAEMDASNTHFEVKVNKSCRKDIDVQYVSKEYTFNIEVKCARFDEVEKTSGSQIKFGTIGRIPGKGIAELKELSSLLGCSPVVSKNMDNNLKEFLTNAHKKFNDDSRENEINVLIVGCGDTHDIQRWYDYLFANEGLFTKNSFESHNNFQNVDLVVLTDRYFRHRHYLDSDIISSWTLNNGLNLIFRNPYRKADKNEGIKVFDTILHNYTKEFVEYSSKYMRDNEMRGIPKEVSASSIITHFVFDELGFDQSVAIYKARFDKENQRK